MKQLVGLLSSLGLLAAVLPAANLALLIRALFAGAGLVGLLLPAAGAATNRTVSWWAVILLNARPVHRPS